MFKDYFCTCGQSIGVHYSDNNQKSKDHFKSVVSEFAATHDCSEEGYRVWRKELKTAVRQLYG